MDGVTADQELILRATEAWERHNAAPRISGGPDGLRREFVAGYLARAAEIPGTDDLNAARLWWLDHPVYIDHVPTDDEVLARWRYQGRP